MKSKNRAHIAKGRMSFRRKMLKSIDEKLSPSERHVVEKHLLECELCADAMEGLKLFRNQGK